MNDEIEARLAAWLDGALPPQDAAAFEAELAADPELAACAQSWRANDAFIAEALAPLVEAPIDRAMLEKMGLADPVAANDNPPWWRRRALPLGGAIAASLALVLVMAQPGQAPRDELSLALDTTPSLKEVRLADGQTITPVLTLRAADGRWCREYQSAGTISIACRKDGRWTVEGSGKGAGPAPASDFELASGADGSALDAAYRKLGAGDPVGAEREAELIGSGWNGR
jgi:hypothetical protein